ncbi:MAG: metal ABC transporter substrate-binding protein [Clostridia bacterium]|nr:metal ABC transporter substrate-binding protein [Clostridia bacterium]
MRLKKFNLCVLITTIIILMAGCGQKMESEPAAGSNKLTIVTSFYPVYVHTINVVKDIPGIKVVNLTEPQKGCLHDYSLTTDNMKTLNDAQIFVINGAGIEAFMDKVTKQLPDLKVIEASEGIELLEEKHNHEDTEKAEEHIEEVNPHVWVSISKAIQQVQNIGRKLAEYDPDNESGYKANTEAYVKRLEEQKEKMHKALKDLKNRRIVTFHEAFTYFAKEFVLDIAAVIEREPGSDPSAQELKDTIETVRKNNIKALFAEPQYSSGAAETISRETGAKVFTLDPAVTGEANGDTDAYIKIMDKNLDVLREALK